METDIDESIAYGQSGYGDYVENRVSTLKCTGGDLGGGSESLILKQTKDEDIYVVTDASHTQVYINQSPTLSSVLFSLTLAAFVLFLRGMIL